MPKGESRSKKKKANELQKTMLQPIIEYNKVVSENGETVAMMNTLKQFHDLGLISDENYQEMQDLAVINEGLRKIAESKHTEKTEELTELDTSKLYPGQVVPNYRKLCELLNVEPTTGEAKKNQEKFFLRFFDFEKMEHSNEILILEIYPEPLPSEETKQYRNSLYSNQLKVLIMCELVDFFKKNNGLISYCTSFSKLIKKLQLINPYFFNKEIDEFFVEKFEIEFFDKIINPETVRNKLKFFKSDTRGKIKNAITYSLDALQKDGLLSYERYNVIVSLNGIHSRAKPDEEDLIQTLKAKTAEELGYQNAQIATIYKPEVFNRALTKRYHEVGWDYVYYQLEVTPIRDFQNKRINTFTAYHDSRKISEITEREKEQYSESFKENLCSEIIEQLKSKKKKELVKMVESLKRTAPEITEGLTDDEIVEYLHLNENRLIEWFGKEYVEERTLFINYLIETDSMRDKEIFDFIIARRKQQEELQKQLEEQFN